MTVSGMSVIGERLKKARESRALTIDQVQKQTRIHSSVLIALEEGRCDKMLTPTYVKSFLKKYSLHLGLDSKELMSHYLAAHPELRSQEPVSGPISKDGGAGLKRYELAAIFKKAMPFIIGAAALVILAVIVSGAANFFFGKSHRSRIAASEKRKSVKSTKPAPKSDNNLPAKQSASSKDAVKKETTALKSASAGLLVPKNEALNLVIKAKNGVFVRAVADGEQIFRKHLPKGKEETVIADDSISLYIGKSEAVTLSLNGKLIKIKKGEIKDLLITRKGFQVK